LSECEFLPGRKKYFGVAETVIMADIPIRGKFFSLSKFLSLKNKNI